MELNPNTPIETELVTVDASASPLVAILGPTGSGKSHLSLEIAAEFGGEIVNCDSLQVFRHFNVGTAKLAEEERRGIAHHLIDIADPDELFTAGAYARRARETIAGISARGRLPIVVGGTGFYWRALYDGLFTGPERDEALRQRLAQREERRPGSLHKILRRFDPAAARTIHPHDVPKVTRAVEVCLLMRQPVSELFERGRDALDGYRALKIGLFPERDGLYHRLDARCLEMFQGGLIDEVRRTLDLGFAPTAKPFESHGYKQALQVLRGELTLKEAIFYAQRNTRRYAKRQMTWFRQEAGLTWIKGFGDAPDTREKAFVLVHSFLTSLT